LRERERFRAFISHTLKFDQHQGIETMDNDNEMSFTPTALRRRAEEQLETTASTDLSGTDHDTLRLLHELQVHQIELEMQNAELHQARHDVESLLVKYTDLYDFAPVGYFTLDRSSVISEANLSGARLLGVERSRLIDRRFGLFVAPADRSTFAAILEKVFTNTTILSCELTLSTEEIDPRQVRIEAIAAASGQECRMVVADITELQRARQDLLKSQKLESLGVLAGGLAHDFNNILTAILGNISLARMQAEQPDKLEQCLEQAENAAVRAKDLTRRLLTFSQGGSPLKKTIIINNLLEQTINHAIRDTTVTCTFALADDLLPVDIDEEQFSQVIGNLVKNALQAMPAGGTISVASRNAALPPGGEQYVEISIADSGTGIPEQLQQRIFDPYFTTRDQGSGLGLAACYSIIKKHDGSIAVKSVPGKGTTVHISLPAVHVSEKPVPTAPHALYNGAGRILLMDDEEMVRNIVTSMLEELGYLVECTKSGSEAIELYRQRLAEGIPFAAVIMDLVIPGGIGGKVAISSLLRIDPQVKVVVSSGYSEDAVLADYRGYGFSAVLSKPFRLQDLSRVLHELLGPAS